MDTDKIFVGRKAELEQFKEVLEDKQGQAVLVVGHRGMGKTWLINKMASTAENHPDLKCGWVRYEVTPTDSVDSTMALMMDNAFEAGQITEGSFDGTKRGLEQWRAFLNVLRLGDLVLSLRRDPAKNTREQFLERLRLISKRMPENGRAVFIIDPEKYMEEKSDQSWAIMVKSLPEKIKFVFAQRPEDEVVKGRAFKRLENICYILDERLGALGELDVEQLVQLRANDVGQSESVLQKAVKQYKGHPYAIVGALDIVKKTKGVEGLPQDPTPEAIAEAQWERICKSGEGAMKLFEAYAILEVGVPNDVVQAVGNLKTSKLKKLLSDKYLGGLLREEGEGRRVYHAILADYIVGQIGEAEKREYHARVVGIYREKLAKAKKGKVKPDELAARRLAEHVLAAEGPEAFIDSFVSECTRPLFNLGLLDAAISLSERALERIEKSSGGEAAVLGNLGLIYRKRGDLDKAEEMHRKALEINEKLGRLEGIARQYGNLGLIYQTRGDLDKAEEMYKKALEIDKKIGRLEGQAIRYGNLGNIFTVKGDLDKAEEMFRKILEIHKKLRHQEGMASEYGNLGNIFFAKGNLDKAEKMYKKGLEIDEKIGHLEGVARHSSNLGVIYKQRGDIGKAKKYWQKALELYKKIGMRHMVEKVQGWIDSAGGG